MRKQFLLSTLILIALFATGCDRLKPGYYLTPANYPTSPVTQVSEAQVTPASPTPPSTVHPIDEPTITPIATVILPTATIVTTLTPTLIPCTEPQGQIVQQTLFSAAVNSDVHYQVYLPPCYESSQRRYPVVYMLHGLGAGMDDHQWIRVGLTDAEDTGIANGTLPPMIIVMPNGNDAKYILDAGPFPAFVTNDLIPAIDADFCTWNDRAMRAIGGLSRGGFWAYWIAFSHPEMFSRVGGHSPYFYDPIYTDEENPFNIVDTAQIDHLAMYMDHGGVNREINEIQPSVQEMLARLKARGLDAQYVANSSGDHDESYWSAHTSEYLTFYAEAWPRDISQYPSCLANP